MRGERPQRRPTDGHGMARPTSVDVVRRLVILKAVVATAISAPPRDLLEKLQSQWSDDERDAFREKGEAQQRRFCERLHELGLWQYMSPSEQQLAAMTVVTMT